MNHRRRVLVIGAVALAAVGLGAGVALTAGSSSPTAGSSSPSQGTAVSEQTSASSYAYYRSMMGRFGTSSMMGGTYESMMSSTSYRWMMGGTSAPGWMRGGNLPSYMMGTGTDPGKVMGALLANAPGPRVSSTQATHLGNETPPGATVNRADHRITFSGSTVRLVALASPSGGRDETFRIAGMVNPTISVHAGSRVSIEIVNADPDTAHGFVVTASGSTPSSMPMATSVPAFGGSALWFLGNPTSAGMHAGTLSFTAATVGPYRYLCAVPGHARKGMVGSFVVAG